MFVWASPHATRYLLATGGQQQVDIGTGWAYLVGYPNTGKEELIKSSQPVFSYSPATPGSQYKLRTPLALAMAAVSLIS
eukprot:11156323-Ditylum_brightwellii.AAC.1